eukprot:10294777-Heterocapsa_arctica.AAC.1
MAPHAINNDQMAKAMPATAIPTSSSRATSQPQAEQCFHVRLTEELDAGTDQPCTPGGGGAYRLDGHASPYHDVLHVDCKVEQGLHGDLQGFLRRDSAKSGQKQVITDNHEFMQFKRDIENIKNLVLKNCTTSQDDSKLIKGINETYVYISKGLTYFRGDNIRPFIVEKEALKNIAEDSNFTFGDGIDIDMLIESVIVTKH